MPLLLTHDLCQWYLNLYTVACIQTLPRIDNKKGVLGDGLTLIVLNSCDKRTLKVMKNCVIRLPIRKKKEPDNLHVRHSTLTQRLQTEFGVSGTALSWIQSYLHGRTQYVKMGQHRSSEATLEVGVPQGSVLGPLLFAVSCSPVADVMASHDVRCHQYADDTQLHLAMCADNTADGLSVLTACTTDVKQWYMQNGLQLNPTSPRYFLWEQPISCRRSYL